MVNTGELILDVGPPLGVRLRVGSERRLWTRAELARVYRACPAVHMDLHSAAAAGDIEAVRLALKGVAAHTQEEEHGRSALMLAAAGGHEAVVSLLLSSGARTSVQHKPDVAVPRGPSG